jgi:hypothetical protein
MPNAQEKRVKALDGLEAVDMVYLSLLMLSRVV